MGGKFPISAVIIASNEAHNIRRCVASVNTWTEEVILVVNDCKDGTDKIAAELGAKVFHHEWQGYRDQKNLALSKAQQQWVLSIDADEEVTEELKASIINFISEPQQKYNGAYFNRKIFFLGRWIKHGLWYPDHCLRLFRKDKGKWAGPSVHETMYVEGKTKKLQGDLNHYSFPTIRHHLDKIGHFGELFEKQNKKIKGPLNIFMRSLSIFFKSYIVRRGFLDGFPGLYIAVASAFSTMYKYTRQYEKKVLHKSTKD